MRSLLDICNDVCDDIQILRPGAIVGNANTDSRRLLRAANSVGRMLMQEYAWQALTKTVSFTAQNQALQPDVLPEGFDRFVPETFWDLTAQVLLAGPISLVEHQSRLVRESGVGPRKFYFGEGRISVTPPPVGNESYSFGYVSDLWVRSAGGVEQPEFLADSDASLFDADLLVCGMIVFLLENEGQPTAGAERKYQQKLDKLTGSDTPTASVLNAGEINGGRGRHFNGVPSGVGGFSNG